MTGKTKYIAIEDAAGYLRENWNIPLSSSALQILRFRRIGPPLRPKGYPKVELDMWARVTVARHKEFAGFDQYFYGFANAPKILIIDDEWDPRYSRWLRTQCIAFGLKPILAHGALQALRAIDDEDGRFDAVMIPFPLADIEMLLALEDLLRDCRIPLLRPLREDLFGKRRGNEEIVLRGLGSSDLREAIEKLPDEMCKNLRLDNVIEQDGDPGEEPKVRHVLYDMYWGNLHKRFPD